MEQFVTMVVDLFPDAIFYILTAVVLAIGFFKCCIPVARNTAALRRSSDLLKEGAKAKLSRPVWSDAYFLGKRLQPVWRTFLHSVDLSVTRGMACDVADYIHEDSIITDPGKSSIADIIPGICTSLGILGTFVGLSIGLNGMDIMVMDSYIQLTNGIALAFNTSIVGLIGSLAFNIYNRHITGRARNAIVRFQNAFYTYAMPQPAEITTQIAAYTREQADKIENFSQDMSVRVAAEVHQAMSASLDPIQQTLKDFMNAATRAQIDGLDFIVARFVDRMNNTLDGQLQRLRETLTLTVDGQKKSQMDMINTVGAMDGLMQSITNIQSVSEEVITKFATYLQQMDKAYKEVSTTHSDTTMLLDEISQASLRQARYLSALQDYQTKLQSTFQDYTVWTDQYVNCLDERTMAQTDALDHVAIEMRESSDLLRSSYKSFVESIEIGLANALGLFDDNMQTLTKQVHNMLSEIQKTIVSLDASLERHIPNDATSKPAGNNESVREVS